MEVIKGSMARQGIKIDAFSLHSKSPGVFIKLSWTCRGNVLSSQHEHDISIDLIYLFTVIYIAHFP